MADVGPGAGVAETRQAFVQTITFGIDGHSYGGEYRFGPGERLEELMDLVPHARGGSENDDRRDPEQARNDHEDDERRCGHSADATAVLVRHRSPDEDLELGKPVVAFEHEVEIEKIVGLELRPEMRFGEFGRHSPDLHPDAG